MPPKGPDRLQCHLPAPHPTSSVMSLSHSEEPSLTTPAPTTILNLVLCVPQSPSSSFFFFFPAAKSNLRDLSSLTRDQTQAFRVRARSPNHWTAREVPQSLSWQTVVSEFVHFPDADCLPHQAGALAGPGLFGSSPPRSVPGSERSPGEGNGNPLQYSCLENFMGRRMWWTVAHGVAKSRTWLSD